MSPGRVPHPDFAIDWDRLLSGSRHLGIAVSGGGDSMALLQLAKAECARRGLALSAATLDHGLRPGSAAEAQFVAKHCCSEDILHQTLRWHGWDGQGNLQAEASAARYGLLADWARQAGVDRIALGHTSDDQAETVLIRLSRSAGVDGLSEMARLFQREDMLWIRPLLDLSRAALRHYLTGAGIGWIEDPSNSDERFLRVRARDALAALAPLGITRDGLTQVAVHMSNARRALESFARQEGQNRFILDRGDVLLPQSIDDPLPVEIERRLRIAALQFLSGRAYAPRARAMQELDEGLASVGTHTLSGCLISLERDRQGQDILRITREFRAVEALRVGCTALWDRRWTLTGPSAPDLEIAALGPDGLGQCPDWRDSGLPRRSLLSSPALWRGAELIAAPVAGLGNGWHAEHLGLSELLSRLEPGCRFAK